MKANKNKTGKAKNLFLFAFAILLFVGFQNANSQVSLTATVGTLSGTYTTIKGAFDKINDGTHRGVITISLTGNTTENSAATLNASGSGSASYTSVGISPSGGSARTITGTVNGNGMFVLNGADYVTFDGLNTGGNSLSIENYSTTGVTFLFTNDATYNTITNCTVKGNNTSTNFDQYRGIVSFGNAASGGTGNDNNTISYCDLRDGYYSSYYMAIWAYNTTANTFNDYITISNCNIYNFYFNSTSGQVSSSGIYAYTGNSNWTITGNSFYQTTNRYPTNYSVVNAIYIRGSGGNNFTITNNYIGGQATQCGGSAMYYSNSSSSTSWNACVPIILEVGSTTASSLQNNTIKNIYYSTAGYDNTYGRFKAIYVKSSSKVNIGDVTGNTIGSTSANGSITISGSGSYCGYHSGIEYNGVEGVSISNNIVSGITSDCSGSGSFWGIMIGSSISGNITVNNNTIGSTSTSNSIYYTNSSNSFGLYGISVSSGSTATVSNNTISNFTNVSTSSGFITGLYIIGGSVNVTTNNINTLKFAQNYSSPQLYPLCGMYFGTSGQVNVSGNTIHTLKHTNASASYGYVFGISINSVSSSSTSVFEKNFIHSISNQNLSGTNFFLCGMNITYGKMLFKNNMVRMGYDETGTNINATPIMDALFCQGTSDSLFFYNNTVYMGGSCSGTASRNSTCFRGNTSNPMIIKNNIFVNTRALTTPGSYYSACMELQTTSLCEGTNTVSTNSTNKILDYNCYYYSGNATYIAYYGNTLNNWKNFSRGEYNSIMSDPKLKNPTGSTSTIDLHIDNAQASPVEGAGVDISAVTDDFDGESRSGLTPVDIGADAGSFTNYDAFAPGIKFTVLSFKPGTYGSRTLSAVEFFDPHGIASGGTAPRVYYRKNSGTWYSNGGTYISGGSTNAVYDMTIDETLVGGITAGDLIEYYVVAQENTNGYLGSYPAGVVGTNVNTITTAPTTLFSFRAGMTLSGNYRIGSAQSSPFNSINNAISCFNYSVLSGAVTFLLDDASYTITTKPVILYNSDASATNTLTIKPNSGVTCSITGNLASALLELRGIDYVIIDGSNNGTTSKDLSFTNTNSSGSLIHISNGSTSCGGGDGSTYITVKNTNLTGGSTTAGYGIFTGSTTLGSSGNNHNYNTYSNNTIQKVGRGIQVYGTINNLSISNNTIGSGSSSNYVGIEGINLTSVSTSTVSGNTIYNINSTSTSGIEGMDIASGCSSITIEKNIVYGVKYSGSSGYGARGIQIFGSSITVRNNLVFDIGGDGASAGTSMIAGIYSNANTNLFYFNTVYLSGTYNSKASGNVCAAIYFGTSGSTGLNLRNNILENTISNATSGTKSYAIYSAIAKTAFTAIDYNDYYVSGTRGILGYLSSDCSTLANIVTNFGGNTNSLNVDPLFANPGGTTSSDYFPEANLTGTSISGITDDYTGSTRYTTPSIGAIENKYVWSGTAGTDWNTASNWVNGVVPTSNKSILIPSSGVSNNCILPANITISNLYHNNATYILNTNGYILTVTGATTYTNGATISAGSGNVTYQGTSAQIIYASGFSGNSVINLTINNSSGVTLSGDLSVSNTLTLTNGILSLGSSNLTISSSGSIGGTPSASNMIVTNGTGELRKSFSGPGSFTYPIGDNNSGAKYSPITLDFTSGTFNSAYAGLIVTNSKHPNNSSSFDYLNRYWAVTQSGITGFSCNVTCNYLVADVNGNEANIYTGKWDGSSWLLLGVTNTGSHYLSGTVSSFSQFTGGEQSIMPVTLQAFSADVTKNDVKLTWVTGKESNNKGFEIERKKDNEWIKAGSVEGKGNTNVSTTYQFKDAKLSSGKYQYRLKQIDFNGFCQYHMLNSIVTVGIPSTFELSQNYPNPFNPFTKIDFQIPKDSKVTLKIYDITGREVSTLINNEFRCADYYTVTFNGGNLASGIYLYKLYTEKFTQIKKMALIK